jgi:hypothetical protein
LHFGGAVVTDSPSQAVAMAQTEHSTSGGNLDGHAQGEKLQWLPLPTFCLEKKKKKKNTSNLPVASTLVSLTNNKSSILNESEY